MEQSGLEFTPSKIANLHIWHSMNKEDQKRLIYEAGRANQIDHADIITAQNNLNVFNAFLEKSFYVVSRGRERFSARMIIENLRWHSMVEDNCPEFKINNNLTKLFALISMELFPTLNALFQIRNHGE